MRGTILIAIKGPKQIEEMIPALNNAVKTGTRVIFLLRDHISSVQLCFLSDVNVLQPGASAALAARWACLGAEALLIEQRISAACQGLSRRGIGVTVDRYRGGLSKAIRKYAARENVQLIMMANGMVPGIMRFARQPFRLGRFSKRRQVSPKLLFRSEPAA